MARDWTHSKRKKLASARKLVGPSMEVVAYGSGKGHTRGCRRLSSASDAYVVAFIAVQIVLGRFLIPGVLLILVVYYLIRPLRGIAITPFGVLVMHESMANGQPSSVLLVAPRDALGAFDEHLKGEGDMCESRWARSHPSESGTSRESLVLAMEEFFPPSVGLVEHHPLLPCRPQVGLQIHCLGSSIAIGMANDGPNRSPRMGLCTPISFIRRLQTNRLADQGLCVNSNQPVAIHLATYLRPLERP